MAKQIYFEDIKIGDAMPVLVKGPVEKTQLVRYAGASGDFNPIHVDVEAAQAAGLGGIIAHGMLVMGFVGQAITNWIPKRNLKKFSVRFAGMTRLGDTLTITGRVVDKKETDDEKRIVCDVETKTQNGVLVIAATFEAQLPSK